MSNPKGNPGNKGGGRKSAYVEGQNAEILRSIVFGKVDVEKLRRRIKSGRYGGIHRIALDILEGKITPQVFNRIFPEVKEKQVEPVEVFRQLQVLLGQGKLQVSEHTMKLYEQEKLKESNSPSGGEISPSVESLAGG